MNVIIEITEDGSPTAHFEAFEQERMHHSGGAFGETMYIYGPAMQWAFAKVETPRLLSLGMGLGYNEIIATAFGILFEQDFILDSYEANANLNSAFHSWLFKDTQAALFTTTSNAALSNAYDFILKKTSDVFEISSEDLFRKLQSQIHQKKWNIHGAFEHPSSKYNAILYDFFSKKAMERFWTETYLTDFFKEASADFCALATYACTGALKRALKANEFKYFERKGYLWKRTSSFARKDPQTLK